MRELFGLLMLLVSILTFCDGFYLVSVFSVIIMLSMMEGENRNER